MASEPAGIPFYMDRLRTPACGVLVSS
jgi:hypothetical protein